MLRNLRELYQYRALLFSLTQRELKARYRGSVLGFLWTFLNPMLHMAVYGLVFRFALKQQVEKYLYFMFVGLLPWICFSTSVAGGVSAISDRRDLLTKVRFPAQVLPATLVLTNVINYLFSLPLMFVLGALHGVTPTRHVVMFVPVLAIQILLMLGFAYLFSALNVAFRDLQHIVGNLLMLAFFLTPVLWPAQNLADKPTLHWIEMNVNPMAPLVTAYQAIFYDHTWPDVVGLLRVLLIAIGLLFVSSLIFERRREEFAELV